MAMKWIQTWIVIDETDGDVFAFDTQEEAKHFIEETYFCESSPLYGHDFTVEEGVNPA